MTQDVNDARIQYTAVGGETTFDYDFNITASSHLVVDLDGTSLVEDTDFSVSGVGAATGGEISLIGSYSGGATAAQVWTLYRDVPIERTADYQTLGDFRATTVNTEEDAQIQIMQELRRDIDRSMVLPTNAADGVSTALPLPVALKSIRWNASATALEEADDPGAATDAAAASAAAALASENAAQSSEDDAQISEDNAATHESNASGFATAASNSAASAAASAQGFAGVTLITAASEDIEVADARTYYQVDATSNTVDMNLPAIGTEDGLSYSVEVLDVSNTITLVRDGTDTINGVAGNYTGLVEAGQVIQIIADDGSPDNWIVVQSSALSVDDVTVELNGRTISVKDDGITPAKAVAGVNEQTGTTYTFALTDNLKTVALSNASAVAVTVPTNAAIAFTADETRLDIMNEGAGEVTITGDTGVLINDVSGGSFTLAQYKGASLIKRDTNTWLAPNQTVA